MTPTRHFLGWHAPIVELAVGRLIGGWRDGPPDLGRVVAVVPTLQSGRRLRQALAAAAASHNTGLFPPHTVTPDFFLRPDDRDTTIAGDAQRTAAWAQAASTCDIDHLRSLFPVKPESQSEPRWALDIAAKMSSLRSLLADNGLSIRDVASRGLEAVEETERWNDLATLERAYLDLLHGAGLKDPLEAEIRRAVHPPDLGEFDRIIVIAVPDPAPLAVRALDNIASRISTEVWVHAPPDKADMFDAWGRPIPEKWEEACIRLPDPDAIRLKGNGESQAEEIMAILAARGEVIDASTFAVAAPNQALFPSIEKAFADHAVQAYNPAGEPLSGHPLFHIVSSLVNLVLSRDYESLAALVRAPAVLTAVSRAHPEFEPGRALAQMDAFQNEHLASGLDDIREFLDADAGGRYRDFATVFATLCARISPFPRQAPPAFVRGFLAFVYEGVRLDMSRPDARMHLDAASLVESTLRDMEGALFTAPGLEPRMQLHILTDTLARKNLYVDHPENAVPVQGWLEIPWEPAPALVIAGMNEGYVPESVLGDVFLPDIPRERLGLKNNRVRFARDVYLFAAMIASRPAGGVSCIAGKIDVLGDPLKPSRLLFLCPDGELPDRARRLFAELDEPRQEVLQPQRQWLLKPPRVAAPDSLPVTAFRAYLECPFRFYLSHVAGMRAVDDRKLELDARDFGVACHRPLELLGRNADLAACTDEHVLRAFLHEQAGSFMREKYGRHLSLTLAVQLDAVKERLARVAHIEAGIRREGWRTVATEYRPGNGEGVIMNGMRIRGTIDRIDRRGDVIRILDYKTSDSPADPARSHVRAAADSAPGWACFSYRGKPNRWTDLQLPLYCLLLRQDAAYRSLAMECGYFNMPKAIGDTALALWDGIDENMLDSARSCALQVIENIRKGIFWPPAESVACDDFGDLSIDSLKNAVDVEGWRGAHEQSAEH
ncbi:MAG: hypothetical protein GF418_11215 [Chitinivibrionales bacterium]|nr:hypothetical protein [Chitinivibrionales bacterium]MBD3396185.1 hypothetical protein [Chitinivibrionales bacterium]